METPDFQGVIGDDWRDSTPWWPEVPTPPAGRAQRGAGRPRRRGIRPAGLLRIGHRHPDHRRFGRSRGPTDQLPHHRAVLAHPGLPADRAQPSPQRARAGGRPGRRAFPDTTARSPRRTASCPRSCASRATPPMPWASGTSPPTTRPTWPLRATAGRWPGVSTAGTGSTAARPTSSFPPSTTTITRSSRRGRSRRATT